MKKALYQFIPHYYEDKFPRFCTENDGSIMIDDGAVHSLWCTYIHILHPADIKSSSHNIFKN